MISLYRFLTSIMNFLSLPCTRDRWDLDLSTLRKTCIFISWTTRVHGIELFRITDCVKKKKKERTAPMIKISWQSRDITWLSRFDEKNCLSGFTVTSTRTLSKRENLDNCEPRGEGLASRLPARTRIIVVLWWAPDTSLLSLRESLPLDSSLSLVPLSRLASRFPRVSREISHSTRLRVERLRFMITIRRS